MNKICFLIYFIFSISCNNSFVNHFSQIANNNSIELFGYYIFVDGIWFFYESRENDNNFISKGLEKSFQLGTSSLPGIKMLPGQPLGSDLKLNNLKSRNEALVSNQSIYFFYGRLNFIPYKENVNKDIHLNKCKYSYSHNKKSFTIGCYFFYNRILEVEPFDPDIKSSYLIYIRTKHLPEPSWAE